LTEVTVQLPPKLRPIFLGAADVRGAFGGRGCCHPDTLIDTPSGQVKISEFKGGSVYSVLDGRVVIAPATPSIPYDEQQLYLVTLLDGRSMSVTDEHRFLTNRGWVELQDLTMADSVYVASPSELCLPATNSEHGLSASREDAPHYSEKHEGYPGGYFSYSRRYDQQPPILSDIVLVSSPSQVGEPQHSSHTWTHADDLANENTDTRELPSRHLSSQRVLLAAAAKSSVAEGSYSDGKASAQPLELCRDVALYQQKTFLREPSQEFHSLGLYHDNLKSQDGKKRTIPGMPRLGVHDSSWFSPSCVHDRHSLIGIQSICKHDRLVYWDLHVPVLENYLSNGIVNHNSGKTRSFAKMAAVRGMMFGSSGVSGIIVCARLFMNSLEDSSLEEVKRAIQDEQWLADYYDVGDKYIKSKDGRISFAFSGLDRNIASIKSKGRILICWVDEASPVTNDAWSTLIPTLREEGTDWNAELWVTWNPEREVDAVEKRFRLSTDSLVRMVELNWRDNPKFPAKLERERLRDLEERPDQYDHIWEGGYKRSVEGAYYAKALAEAKEQGRIGNLSADPLMTLRAYWDIGGTGAKADACAIWIVQFIGKEIRVLDHYETVGQPLSVHVQWLRDHGYGKAELVLPHDGAQHDKVFQVSYQSALMEAQFDVRVIPNMGAGAASRRIEAMRRAFPSMWFDEKKTEAGRSALGWYHEKRDENRNIGLGPHHDWSSHSADAAGLIAVDYATLNLGAMPNISFTTQFTREGFGQRSELFHG